MPNVYAFGHSGHAKGDVRDAFLEALESFYRWRGRGRPPTVTIDDQVFSLAKIAGMLWNCSDVLPGEYSSLFDERPSTYARAARLLKGKLSPGLVARVRHGKV